MRRGGQLDAGRVLARAFADEWREIDVVTSEQASWAEEPGAVVPVQGLSF